MSKLTKDSTAEVAAALADTTNASTPRVATPTPTRKVFGEARPKSANPHGRGHSRRASGSSFDFAAMKAAAAEVVAAAQAKAATSANANGNSLAAIAEVDSTPSTPEFKR